jgi:hypothetical protein
MRKTCDAIGDCPIVKARLRSQHDCLVCILNDVETMKNELKALRQWKLEQTIYGTSITKLEASLDPDLLPMLKKQLRRSD